LPDAQHSTPRPISLWRQAVEASVLNFLINAAISWLVFHNTNMLTVWGVGGIGVDLLATGFLLPFLTCLIVSNIIAGQVRSGKIAPDTRGSVANPGANPSWHQRTILIRSLWLGAAGVLLAASPVVLTLTLFEPTTIRLWSFILFKGIWAGALAGAITPFITRWAVTSASPTSDPTPQNAVPT